MSESETTEAAGQETKHENSPRKRMRHRKKQLYENILKQMEFYFSDANLSKDRYLGDLIKHDPYVPLEVFLKFNKIRSITNDVIDIAKAMKHSTLLELSEDRLKVKRKTPICPYNADLRTVYVESIPVTASREWLQRVFSDYGSVAYISLPMFRNSERIKGYAFIEFSKPEDAQKCIHAFTKMGCKLPTCMPPEQLTSIKMFSVEEPSDDMDNKEVKEEYEPPKKKTKKSKEKKQKHLELKLNTNESDSEKRVETPSDDNKSIATPTEEDNKSITTPIEETKAVDVESKDDITSQDESKIDSSNPRKKKARKRIAKEKKTKSDSKTEAPKGALWGLQILSKNEWKALRNKYLNLQRKYMKELKKNLQNSRHSYSSMPAPAAPAMEVDPTGNQDVKGTSSVEKLEKIPGVFVKELLPEPCLDVRLTKRTIRSNIHVQHVDVKEGQSEIVIRFDSAKAADDYCASVSSARVMGGAEQDEQWSRAEAARRTRRARGRDRLLARSASAPLAPASPQPTNTHLRFDE